MNHLRQHWAAGAAMVLAAAVSAQDLYDTTVLRTINLTFYDDDWLELLEDYYWSETNILADLEMEGEVYTGVGVRIRGHTSYLFLPPGSEKFSFNIEVDYTDAVSYTHLTLPTN